MNTQVTSFYAATLIFVLTTNLMLIYGFYKTSRPFTIITKLFIYLSVVDIIYTIIAIKVYIFSRTEFVNHKLFPALAMALLISIFVLEMLIFWTISSLRFLSIYKPMYRVKSAKVYIVLLIELLSSFLIAIAILWIYNLTIQVITITLIVSVVLQLVMLFMNLILNMSSLIILTRSTNMKTQQKGDCVLANQMSIMRKKKALNTLLLIILVHLICTIPLTLLYIDPRYIMKLFQNKFNVFGFCQCLQISSFGFNSFIIILRTKNLRQFYIIKSCCFMRKADFNIQITEMN